MILITKKQTMKKSLNVITGLVIAGSVLLSACQNNRAAERKSYDEFKNYIVLHVDSSEHYYGDSWENLENEYMARKQAAEQNLDKFDEETKAEYNELTDNWEKFHKDYVNYQNVKATDEFRKSLIPADIKQDFSNVTPERLLSVYEYFVDFVDKNKDTFSREQWDEIKIMWERLDTRKNEIEKELPSGDNTKIAGLKIKFAAIKTVNRAETKSDENEEAKGEIKCRANLKRVKNCILFWEKAGPATVRFFYCQDSGRFKGSVLFIE
jgi:hypothetical protein